MPAVDSKQTDLDDPAVGWQVAFEVRQLAVQRERTSAAPRDHADQGPAVETDCICVLGMESIHQPSRFVGRMLRNLLDESAVVQPEDGLELG